VLSRRTKIRLYKAVVVLACEPYTKADEKKLMKFEQKILRRIFGLKKKILKKKRYQRKTNAEQSRELFNVTDIVGVLKIRRLN